MSFSDLPDDMVKQVFGLLLNRNTCRQSDYMSLALTCRRFYYIGVKQFDVIKRLDSRTCELFALNTFVVEKGSYHQKKYPQMYKTYCKSHADGWYDECFERSLSVVLANRTSDVKGLRIIQYNLIHHNCLESIEGSRLDRIVELTLIDCKLPHKGFYTMLAQFKNLASLHLHKYYIADECDCDGEHPEIGLQYLYAGRGMIFDDPQARIFAKVVVIGHDYAPSTFARPQGIHIEDLYSILAYLIRFKHQIKLVRLMCNSTKLWSRLMQICELEVMRWEIIHDMDIIDDGCLCIGHNVINFPYLYPEKFNLSPRSGNPCQECTYIKEGLFGRQLNDHVARELFEINIFESIRALASRIRSGARV